MGFKKQGGGEGGGLEPQTLSPAVSILATRPRPPQHLATLLVKTKMKIWGNRVAHSEGD